ncbi:MAG TPA: hypothetical protein VFL14_10170, partial [Xanthomonadales bacterium]|nr:hypothetical protein [Xanthomonadales bacterium]
MIDMHARTLRLAALALALFANAASSRELAASFTDAGTPIASGIAADGSSVFVSGDGDGHVVTRVSPEGRVVWRTRHAGQLAAPTRAVTHFYAVDDGNDGRRIAANRACFPVLQLPARDFGLACFDYATGAELPFRTVVAAVSGSVGYAAQVQADGSASLLVQSGSGAELRRWDADGAPLAPR